MFGFIKRIFGTSHERMMRKLQPIVARINDFEPQISALSDDDLKGQTPKLKEMLSNGATLDDILPEAFATVREAGKRVLNMRHYDVQLIGGIVLHRGMISEMKTGEGKTLVATSPMYLNALAGKGAHLVTVNDYLASRDADWMGQIYRFLGLSVGKILTDMDNNARRDAYNADITYGTNNEFGFDYLRDNMKYQLSEYVQRGHFYAIVDEVDSILIDEARTPLIISGQLEQDLNLYKEINKLVPFLKRDEDYAVDEKNQSVALNESGIEKLEKHLGIDNIYDPKYFEYLHHVNKALQAHTLYKLDQNYVIENGKIVIIDDFTGRMMHGRRWSDGLHQAIEAKEGVEILPESQTLATITFQNYFRMYEKLAGMTGTADTEAEEFKKIYKLDVVCIPTAKKIIRKDYQDVIYFNEKAKIEAIAKQIQECHAKGQPILVGTVSVEKSEVFSRAISKLGIEHNVLNAKNHKREAEIIAQAGRKGAVTIATNMAGRGTDILLGGNPEFLARREVAETDPAYPEVLAKYKEQCAAEKAEVYAAGGLFILGTERHESRRIDNQLRGRAGRQGDPGVSRFFLSLDDDLLRIFGGEELKATMARFGMAEQADIPIESGIVTRSIETAQKRVEGKNFDIRKSLIEYDDVMNEQRKSIYALRNDVLKGDTLKDDILDAFETIVYNLADKYMPADVAYEDWNMEVLDKTLSGILGEKFEVDYSSVGRGDRDARIHLIWDKIEAHYQEQVKKFNEIVEAFAQNLGDDSPYKPQSGEDLLLQLRQNYYLREIDKFWRAHLTAMTGLREAISLRGYAQKDPKQEYKREAYKLFETMMYNIKMRMMTQVCCIHADVPDISRMRQEDRHRMRTMQKSSSDAAPQSAQQQTEELKAMAAQSRKNSGSLSMAEILAQQNQPKKQSNTPLSMAEIMAQQNAAKKSSGSLSMAEIMANASKKTSNSLSMAEIMASQTRPTQSENANAPQKKLSMTDLLTSSMTAMMEEQRRASQRMLEESRRQEEELADHKEKDAPLKNEDDLSFVTLDKKEDDLSFATLKDSEMTSHSSVVEEDLAVQEESPISMTEEVETNDETSDKENLETVTFDEAEVISAPAEVEEKTTEKEEDLVDNAPIDTEIKLPTFDELFGFKSDEDNPQDKNDDLGLGNLGDLSDLSSDNLFDSKIFDENQKGNDNPFGLHGLKF